jgi:hypothetical protein
MTSGAEFDALTNAKQFYMYLTKAGVSASIKKGYNKRFRKEGKKECDIVE